MALFALVTKFGISAPYINNPNPPLKRILCIYYLLYFWKDIANIKALINSDSKVNIMTSAYISKLGLKI